jgi:nucleoside 2-deoxyribosyltransferase
MFNLYMARPITGCTADEVFEYYENARQVLRVHYRVLSPMTGKEHLRTERLFKAEGYRNPVSTNHAIIERDRWMVQQSDIVLVDLSKAKQVSIGCMMELAWAHQLGKHSIVVMEEGSPHWHAFVLEAADIVMPAIEEALDYLVSLAWVYGAGNS